MNPITQSLIRHFLTAAGGGLVTSGVLTSGQEQTVIGALLALGGIGWSVYQKWAASKAAKQSTTPKGP